MIPFTRYLKLSAIAVSSLTLCAHGAQVPQHIDIKQLSKKVEDIVVPLPNEIFGALNKLGVVNWKEHVRSDRGTNFTERPSIALLLGTVIADGFIAVQAEDAPAVKEIDRTQNSVQQAMNEVHDEKLSQLVSLGGWLRGTEVLTSVVTKRFSVDGAELLHQPDLLSYFQTRLQAMPEFNVPIIHEIEVGLVKVKPLIDVGNARIPPEAVKKINEITTRLGDGIVTRD